MYPEIRCTECSRWSSAQPDVSYCAQCGSLLEKYSDLQVLNGAAAKELKRQNSRDWKFVFVGFAVIIMVSVLIEKATGRAAAPVSMLLFILGLGTFSLANLKCMNTFYERYAALWKNENFRPRFR